VAPPSKTDITLLLQAWSEGDDSAQEKLWSIVFQELKRMARRHMARERPDHTLQSGALVNEAYLRLVDANDQHWSGRTQFFGMCARMMRQILVDHARALHSKKRPTHGRKVSLDDVVLVSKSKGEDLIALDDALKALAAIDPRKCEVVELRFFAGVSIEEAAEILNVSRLTVIRDWNFARAWLRAKMDSPI